MDAYTGLSSTTNIFTPAITTNYKERLTYDANGNIQTYLRNNETGAAKNNYSYTYATGTNRLSSITNNVNAQTKSYAYDNIGNTTGDGMQGITNAVWNVYGKLQSITNKDDVNISYTYSADGQRISKKVGNTEEWYVRDASGNVMLTYTKDAAINSGIISTKEYYKYGSSLLSIKNHIVKVDGHAANEGIITQVRGEDNYILTDANGNTKLTVRDIRTQVEDPANPGQVLYYLADVSTATLHSTYGANAKTYNGGFSSANFNGQRKSKEIGKDAQTALFWEYNGDVGRRWNVDPVVKEFESPYLCFSGNPISIIDVLGNTGKDIIYKQDGKEVGREIRNDRDSHGVFDIIINIGKDAKLITYIDGKIGVEGDLGPEKKVYRNERKSTPTPTPTTSKTETSTSTKSTEVSSATKAGLIVDVTAYTVVATASKAVTEANKISPSAVTAPKSVLSQTLKGAATVGNVASGALLVADVVDNKVIQDKHIIDGLALGITALPVIGQAFGIGWFLGNVISIGVSGKSLSEIIQESAYGEQKQKATVIDFN